MKILMILLLALIATPLWAAEPFTPALALVSFTDYNCPFCKPFDPLLEKIVQEYPQLASVDK